MFSATGSMAGATVGVAAVEQAVGRASSSASSARKAGAYVIGAIPVVVGRSGVQAGPFRAPGLPGRARGREARDAAGLPCQNR